MSAKSFALHTKFMLWLFRPAIARGVLRVVEGMGAELENQETGHKIALPPPIRMIMVQAAYMRETVEQAAVPEHLRVPSDELQRYRTVVVEMCKLSARQQWFPLFRNYFAYLIYTRCILTGAETLHITEGKRNERT